MAKRGLGRGLDALLSGAQSGGDESDSLAQLPIEQIRRGQYQPRVHMRSIRP